MTAAVENEDLLQKLLNDTNEILEFESVPGQCCIYKVPRRLRRVNEEVFTQLISIGPLHHDKPELTEMEKKKKRYMKSFLRPRNNDIEKILCFIRNKEKDIRACYTETSTLKSPEFILMILYDSIFIIEIFLRDKQRDTSDILLATVPLRHTLCTDLQLFENQLPYFVLEEIYRLAFIGIGVPTTFKELSCNFFAAFTSVELTTLYPMRAVKHFTDWRRIALLESYKGPESDEKWIDDLSCAVKLHESGVKFKQHIGTEGKQSLFDKRFEKRKQLIPFFEVHELQIPQLLVNDGTERLVRNMIALEQCLYQKDSRICNYVELMDYLINNKEDVDLLVGNRIISNHMGDNASVAKCLTNLIYFIANHHTITYASSSKNTTTILGTTPRQL